MSDYYGGGEPHSPAPSTGSSQRGLFVALSAVIVAGIVVIVLAITGVFSGSSPVGDSPRQVVEKVLYASKRQNYDDVKKVVCSRDLKDPDFSDIVGKDHATSYSIGTLDEQGNDKVVATITITTSTETATTKLPVIRQDGAWKACFSDINRGDYSTAATPTPPETDTLPPTSATAGTTGPTASPEYNFCASTTSAASTARTFISFIGLDLVDSAADCVYQGALSTAQLKALTGELYSSAGATGTGPTFRFTSATSKSVITVTVERQDDGRYYVTAASKS